MNKIVIELKDVVKEYQMGDVTVSALNGVSLQVKKGEFVSIVGKSGSGKSTLVNQIGCLDTPTRGTVFLDSQNIAKLSESNLAQIRGRKIGFIFQTFNLMPTLSVYENIALPLIFQGTSEESMQKQAQKVIKLVDLEDRSDHKPSELSGGQRQRVAIARALVNDPEVVLADEPTGNLDSKTGFSIMEFLLHLNKKENVTIIMVTHDDDLAKWADRTIILSDGKVINEIKHSAAEQKAAIERFKSEVTSTK
ncbi:MAG: putative ABC transport system ATP-binding protein [Candidatus Woesearchaeota archaeon]|jgi:putative ABC transport system ATP-binding protein